MVISVIAGWNLGLLEHDRHAPAFDFMASSITLQVPLAYGCEGMSIS